MQSAGRSQLWAGGHDESVEVNQRALIDKVLARYSGEFTVFRELLQNSDDAQSREVEIRFETRAYLDSNNEAAATFLPNLRTALVHQWTFKNDGVAFRSEDWDRLKKIAEGNPDEEKIGAFGVGFYSLFSVTEEPFVTSGNQWMGFHWKKDQLLARRGNLPDNDQPSKWTTFEMALREDIPIPNPFDFTRFLASSITFMNFLSSVSVYFDDKRLVKLSKSAGIPKELTLPKTLITSNKSRMMSLAKLKATSLHIQAQVMRLVYTSGSEKAPRSSAVVKPAKPAPSGFFASLFAGLGSAPQPPATPIEAPKPIDPLATDTSAIDLTIFSAEADVRLDKKLAAELHRSTKKSAPKTIKYELIFTGMDEFNASKVEDEQHTFATSSIFQGLRADLDGMGAARIFIGHATGQTTGIGGHMSARYIPSVERELIDLSDRNVAIWNKELLNIGGTVARAVYELEMDNVGASDPETQARRAIHALKFFTFHQSTPSAEVSSLMEQAFFSSFTGFRIPSTMGIRDIADVRLPDEQFSSFLKTLAVIPDAVMAAARPMITGLQNRKLLKAITFSDVLKELSERPLSEEESIACLKWWISLNKDGESASRLHSIRKQLLDAAIFTVGEGSLVPLNTIETIFNPIGGIPSDVPFPPTMLPPAISRPFQPDQLTFAFQWTQLTLVDWIRYIATFQSSTPEFDLSLSPHWSERALGVLTRAWPSLPAVAKDEVKAILRLKACIPTASGLKVPDESYFPNADIFHDLPVIRLPSGQAVKGNLERLLTDLGVRKHVDLQIIFTRMIKTNEWTVPDLIKYLVSVQHSLSEPEKSRLRLTSAFGAETPPGQAPDKKRYRADQLLEPSPAFMQLVEELPILDWGSKVKWRGSSEEAKFLFQLGLQRYPSLPVLVALCANPKPQVRAIAFNYLLDNIKSKYGGYDYQDFHDVKFIPALKNGSPYLGAPGEVLSNGDWAILGLPVLASNVASDIGPKLGLREHPTSAFLVTFLEKNFPRDEVQAKTFFSLMSSRIKDFSPSQLQKLSQMSIVPIKQHKEKGFQMLNIRPGQCFFGKEAKEGFHSKLFVFVDFGTSANSFLSACGAKREPSVDEITLMLLADPHNFYELAGGLESFLGELRNIAVNSHLLSNGTIARLKKAQVLLALHRLVDEKKKKNYDGEDEWEAQYDLKKPDEIVIADDSNALQLFGEQLFVAPQEDILEAFYVTLGSKRLSTLVQENHEISSEIQNSPQASKLRAHILERLPLFLHEHTHARTKVSFNWLRSESNFVVRSFGKISVVKSMKFGGINLSKKQVASAVGPRNSRGPLQIWLANDVEPDMYEVATAFIRLFFEAPKISDSLLFMTLLSTPLQALKRRGYNVERIEQQYKQQRAEQQRQAALDVKAGGIPLSSKTSAPTQAPATPLPGAFPEIPSSTVSGLPQTSGATRVREPPPPPPPAFIDNESSVTSGRPHSMLHMLSQKLRSNKDLENITGPLITSGNPAQGATPLGNICEAEFFFACLTEEVLIVELAAANIDMAIKACRPESGNLLRNREQMQQVKESLNEGYCDISGRAENLVHVGTVESVKVYLSAEVPDKSTFLSHKHASLQRFLSIVMSLAKIYKLLPSSLHIFYDISGPLIAFNRNASIFLNLRFYEAWHDGDVEQGSRNSALVSWYFTLAHEIAHNLVQPHNSEHSFYLQTISEQHLPELVIELSEA